MGSRALSETTVDRLVDYGVIVFRSLGLLINIVFIFGNDFDLTIPLRVALAATAFYALAYLALSKRFGLRRVNLGLIAIDMIVISGGVWATGGLDSSTYLLFFGETIIIALFGKVALTMGFGAIAGLVYYLIVAHDLTTSSHQWAFAYRACVLLVTSLGVGHLGMIIGKQWRVLAQRAADEHRTLEREQALGRVAKVLTSELDRDRILELVLESAVSILGASAGWIAMCNQSGKMKISSVINFSPDLIGSEAPMAIMEVGHEPVPDIAPLQDMGFACTLTASIEVGGEQAGLLALFSREGRNCGPEEHRLLGSLAELAAVSYTNARLFAERQRKEQHLAVLNAIGRRLVERIDIDSAFPNIRQELGRVVSADAFYVAAYDEQQHMISILYFYEDGKVYPASSFPLNDGVTSQAIRHSKVVHIDTHTESEEIPGATWMGSDVKRTRSILVVPMIREERVVGALSVQSYQPGAYDQDHEQLVQMVANQFAVAIENSRLYEQMRRLSLQDWLTGLGNARFFFQCMEREIARADRYTHPLSLIMVDSDKLKTINDRYGHLAGDQHVIQLAEVIRGQTRQADIGIRYAGDEFLVILPETDETSAMIMAERIRQLVEQSPLQVDDVTVPVTVSLGVASYPRHGRTAEELFRNVDAALYQAKRAGKNHTSVFNAGTAALGPMPVV